MKRPIIALLLIFCFFFPLHLYIISGDLGFGVQGAFYRFQETVYGSNVIFLNQEIDYVLSGVYTGNTAVSVLFWVAGALIVFFGSCNLLIIRSGETLTAEKISGLSVVFGGICLLLSCLYQYGFILVGSSGISFPIGIPLIFSCGLLLYTTVDERESQKTFSQ